MTHPEKYARPGVYRDDDNHERLLEENREAYRQEKREKLLQEIREKKQKLQEMSKE